MSISRNNRGRQTFTEINITPLTDVFLVLLVIMLLIAPLLDNQAVLKINPPSAQTAQSKAASDKIKSILIEVDKTGKIAVNGEVIVKSSEKNSVIFNKLYKKVNELAPVDSTKSNKPKVKLKADDKVTHGRIVSIYDAISQAKKKNQVGQLVLVTVKK